MKNKTIVLVKKCLTCKQILEAWVPESEYHRAIAESEVEHLPNCQDPRVYVKTRRVEVETK